MKRVIYTAIFGNYDTLRDPLFVDDSIDYICFTDNENYQSNIWDIQIVEREESTPRRDARKRKILSHEYINSTESVWIDGCILLKDNPFKYYKNVDCDIILSKHWRNCLYEEAERVVKINKADKEVVEKQIDRYVKDKYPRNNGLVDSTVIYRKITPKIIELENLWWEELSNYSKRDQLSFNYCLWKLKLGCGLLNWRKFGKRKPHK